MGTGLCRDVNQTRCVWGVADTHQKSMTYMLKTILLQECSKECAVWILDRPRDYNVLQSKHSVKILWGGSFPMLVHCILIQLSLFNYIWWKNNHRHTYLQTIAWYSTKLRQKHNNVDQFAEIWTKKRKDKSKNINEIGNLYMYTNNKSAPVIHNVIVIWI